MWKVIEEAYPVETTGSVRRPFTASNTHTRYSWIPRILEHPLEDGRRRITWLILGPYFKFVEGVRGGPELDRVVDRTMGWLEESYKLRKPSQRLTRSEVEYLIRKAKVKPLSLKTLQKKHQDVYRQLLKAGVVKG